MFPFKDRQQQKIMEEFGSLVGRSGQISITTNHDFDYFYCVTSSAMGISLL